MVFVHIAELRAVLAQGVWVNIVHTVVLHQQPVVAIIVGIADVRPHLLLGAMVIALVIAAERASEHIVVQIDRAGAPGGLRNLNADNLLAVDFNNSNILAA